MPGLNGAQLCRQIRQIELPRYVYLIILTACGDSADMIAGLRAGADDFVSQPIHRAALLARVEAGARILAMEQKLREASEIDPLTGLLNRRSFHQRFVREWERIQRCGDSSLSCVMIDIDYFKRVNDTYGHLAGDLVISRVAQVLQRECRANDLLCRYGGEEFCLLLPETTEADAACWAERTREAVSRSPVWFDDARVRVTISAGVAEKLRDTCSPEHLAELADLALLTAKHAGRDRVIRYAALHDGVFDLAETMGKLGPFQDVVARDVMSAVITMPREDYRIHEAVDLFLRLNVSSAPVIDKSGSVVGLISENDLLEYTVAGNDWNEPIRNVMRTDVVCYEEQTPLQNVYDFLSRVSLPRVIVVDRRRPVGVISRTTLLRWLRNWTDALRGGPDQCLPTTGQSRREAVVLAARTLAQRAHSLSQSVADDHENYVPRVIGEATRLQCLVNELLAQCSPEPMLQGSCPQE